MAEDDKKPTGRAKGGAVVAAKMTAEQKAERAKKGALARWGAKTPRVTHRGNFKEDFGLDVDCYILDDESKTAVISQRGMGAALGLTTSGQSFIRFAAGKTISPYLGAEIREKIENPIKFQWVPRGAEKQPPGELNGYDVTLLIDVCKAILTADAEDKLLHHQKGLVKQAHIIVNASAKAGIKGLVYALAGYRPEVDEVIQAFKAFVQDEAKKYEAEFPNELYEEWFKLYKIAKPSRGKPWQFLHLTRSHIYYPLAKSNGKILELLRALKAKDGEQKRYLFQFLNDIGARALRMQIGRVLEMAQSSNEDKNVYEAKIIERFGGQPDLPGIDPA